MTRIGLGMDLAALAQEPLQRRAAVGIAQQRAACPFQHALDEQIERRLSQIDMACCLICQAAPSSMNAAARSQHMRRVGLKPCDHLPLTAPEGGLAEALENLLMVQPAAFRSRRRRLQQHAICRPAAVRRTSSRPHHTDQTKVLSSYGWGCTCFAVKFQQDLCDITQFRQKGG